MDREYFYVRDIAKLCCISEEAVRQWIRNGSLNATCKKRTYYISFQDLVDHLSENRRHLAFVYNSLPIGVFQTELKRRLLHAVRRNNHDNANY